MGEERLREIEALARGLAYCTPDSILDAIAELCREVRQREEARRKDITMHRDALRLPHTPL